jgi:hypothetical protein
LAFKSYADSGKAAAKPDNHLVQLFVRQVTGSLAGHEVTKAALQDRLML